MFQDLDLRTWVSGPRKLSILRSFYLFPVTFLCVQWSQTDRRTDPVWVDSFKTRLRTTEISTLIPTVTDRLTSECWSKLYRGRLSGPVLPYKICLSVRPTVRAGSVGGLKRRTVVSDKQTHARMDVVNLYIRSG
jgi:hypothetical protein